jgi:hypothetical protein
MLKRLKLLRLAPRLLESLRLSTAEMEKLVATLNAVTAERDALRIEVKRQGDELTAISDAAEDRVKQIVELSDIMQALAYQQDGELRIRRGSFFEVDAHRDIWRLVANRETDCGVEALVVRLVGLGTH